MRSWNIIGERFGKLVVLGDSSVVKYGCRTVLCQCDCGETICVAPFRLMNGNTKSCGCGRGKRIDPHEMIGNRYGNLVVLEVSDHLIQGTRALLCQCDCGATTYVRPFQLRNGNTKSCGCRKVRDVTGKRFGKLVALELAGYSHPTNGSRMWRCRCDCGNEVIADYKHLAEGERVSCGCAKGGTRPLDVAGKRFGKLIALERMEKKSGTSYKWRCRCDCGRETEVSVANLVNGNSRSCGCLRRERKKRNGTLRWSVLPRGSEA